MNFIKNLFGASETKKQEVKKQSVATNVETVEPKKQTTSELVQEIHETFYTEAERLLAEAKNLINPEPQTEQMKALIEKRSRLYKLGFTNTKEVKDTDLEINRIRIIEAYNQKKSQLAETITYFQFKYPMYKFITEQSVKAICEKYGLVYGTVDKYTGTVPDKNLKEMEEFSISDEDKLYVEGSWSWNNRNARFGSFSGGSWFNYERYIYGYTGMLEHNKNQKNEFDKVVEAQLEIAAPVKDFNMSRSEVVGYKLQDIPDPVVLQPVYRNGSKYYLIATAWGDEAADLLVLNANHN